MSTKIKDLSQHLIRLHENQKLGHFYILKAHALSVKPEQQIQEFLIHFFSLFLNKSISIPSLKSLPDVLMVGDEFEENQSYKVDDLEEMFHFNELAPLSLKHKFIICFHAQKMSQIVLNKLLKILEEPNKKTTIFFALEKNQELLPTIQSRAQIIRLPLEEKGNLYVESNLTKQNIASVIENQKNKDHKIDEELLQESLSKQIHLPKNFQKLNELLKLVQWNKESQAFRNSQNERIFENIIFAKED